MRSLPILLVLLTAAAQAAPSFWGSLRPGAHAVGFRIEHRESAPGAAGPVPRPIEIGVWYPAAARAARQPALTFGQYFELAEDLRRRSTVPEIRTDDLQKTLSVAITGDPAGLSTDVAASILAAPLYARRDAPPADGPFPVVLFSARYGTMAAQAVLAEYLASRGLVVAAVRPKDAREKLPFEAATAQEKLEELEAQTDDLRGALRALRELPYGDDQRAAVIAWSYAGESAWRIAQGDARIELVIALDSNVTDAWVYQSPGALAASRSAPQRAVVEFGKRTPGWTELAHGNFNALEGMIPAVAGIDRVQPWSSAGPKAKSGYERLSRAVGDTLETAFRRPRPKPAWLPVELRAADGAIVQGELYRAVSGGGSCFALFHQSGSSRGEYRTIGPELARVGHTALAIDVRWGNRDRWHDVRNENAARHGTPEALERRDQERIRAIKAGERYDLDAAVDWLRRDGCSRVIVWGASIQANGALDLAARRPDDVAAVIDVSPGEYAKDDPDRMKTIAKRVSQPAFVIWGRDEESLSKPIFDALAGPKASYGSTGRHGNAVFFEDPVAWARLREFMTSLLAPAPPP